jgi:hypothetical protein
VTGQARPANGQIAPPPLAENIDEDVIRIQFDRLAKARIKKR